MVGCCLLPHLPCGSAASHPPSTFNAQKNAAEINRPADDKRQTDRLIQRGKVIRPIIISSRRASQSCIPLAGPQICCHDSMAKIRFSCQ
jgi:hypothetical protein